MSREILQACCGVNDRRLYGSGLRSLLTGPGGLLSKVFIGLAHLVAGITALSTIGHAGEQQLSTRLRIAVDEPMLTKGGAVIVAARPISGRDWRLLETEGSANAYEKEFRVKVSSPASIVELVYPEGGTYSFRLEPVSGHASGMFVTREIRVGSAMVIDPETRQQVDWPSMSIIHVGGTVYDEGWARIFSSTFDLAFENRDESAFSVRRFAAGRIIGLSEAAIEAFIQDSK
ncbi:hypothetical protein [Rhizobium sp. UGM030330-04]|uniref:hypothetical protein n=1 Tax=Rhizobium sp. UGM030330-04 TaxID=1378077 RepID=UPI001AEC928B|nr:hypothetical protein [Rhizobium sp. UGM030330-04]